MSFINQVGVSRSSFFTELPLDIDKVSKLELIQQNIINVFAMFILTRMGLGRLLLSLNFPSLKRSLMEEGEIKLKTDAKDSKI